LGRSLHLIEKQEFKQALLDLIKQQEGSERPAGEVLKSLKKRLSNDLADESSLDEFQRYFQEVDPVFLERINELATDLTPRELRMLSFLKIGLGTKEIATLLHVQVNTVKMSKYRLKKKLFPDSELPLEQLLLQLS
jgi:DNA-binding NarL/FixJ family response regulator